jgi:hypothetical protein
MARYRTVLRFMMLSLLASTLQAADTIERTMNVRQGPESVFDEPVTGLFAELDGARATGENGRVGYELVFWGYSLADRRNVFLFACAMLPDVDCEQRREAVCPTGGAVLARTQVVGKVRRLSCRSVSVDAPGTLRPGCVDTERDQPLDVGVVQCN